MDWYLFIKTIHIILSTILFGTGIGIAFFMFYLSKLETDLRVRATVARVTVLADFIFTTPVVLIQPITGIILAKMAGYDLFESWLVLSYILYIFTGFCWLPVVWIQIQLRDIASLALKNKTELPDRYYSLFKKWFYLGWPAFISVICIFFLMVFKPIFGE